MNSDSAINRLSFLRPNHAQGNRDPGPIGESIEESLYSKGDCTLKQPVRRTFEVLLDEVLEWAAEVAPYKETGFPLPTHLIRQGDRLLQEAYELDLIDRTEPRFCYRCGEMAS